MAPTPNFYLSGAIFPIFRLYFSSFLGEAKTYIYIYIYLSFFSYFGPEARNGVCIPGKQDCNASDPVLVTARFLCKKLGPLKNRNVCPILRVAVFPIL